MKKRSAVAVFLFLLIILYFLSGCQEKDPSCKKLAGKWEHRGFIYEFREDGRLLYRGESYRYDFPEADTIRILRGEETLLLSYEETEDGIKIGGVPMFRHAEENKNIFSAAAELIDRLGKSFSELMSGDGA